MEAKLHAEVPRAFLPHIPLCIVSAPSELAHQWSSIWLRVYVLWLTQLKPKMQLKTVITILKASRSKVKLFTCGKEQL